MRARVLGALALGAVPLALLVRRFDFLCDDAFISWRYARNLAGGAGLRFNLGVEPPVEGYTNLLWVLWCALFEATDAIDVAVAARVTSVALAFLTLAAAVRLVARATDGPLAPVATGLFVGLHPAFATWATSGMETMAFTAAAFLGFERLVVDPERPRTVQAAIALAAASLLRADGALIAGIAAGSALLLGRATGRGGLSRASFVAGLATVAAVALQLGFRLAYHGDWVPNTAHAKVSLDSGVGWSRGALYVAHFLVLFPAVAAAPLLAFGRGRARGRGVALAALGPFAAVYLWYWAAGGDYMAFGRFLVPAIPFAAVAFGFGVAGAPGALRIAIAAVLLVTQVLPAFRLSAAPESLLARLNFRLHKEYTDQVSAWEGLVKGVERGSNKGRALALYAQPGDSLVAGNVGAQAYYSDVFVYDRHGLVTREVAARDVEQGARAAGHAKGVSALWFVKDRPTILLLEIGFVGRPHPADVPEEIQGEYERVELPLTQGRVLHLVVRADSHFVRDAAAREERR